MGVLLGNLIKQTKIGRHLPVDSFTKEVRWPREGRVRQEEEELHVGQLSDRREALVDLRPQRQDDFKVETSLLPSSRLERILVDFQVVKTPASATVDPHGEHQIRFRIVVVSRGAAEHLLWWGWFVCVRG